MSEDMEPRQRRKSTGGQPPRRFFVQQIVEEAPSHDGTPCFTAWTHGTWDGPTPEGFTEEDYPICNSLPRKSIQVYDTTPGSDDPEHLKALVAMLHEELGQSGRLDVWGLPLLPEATVEERVERCKAHNLAEIASRGSGGSPDFHVPPVYTSDRRERFNKWQRAMLIIDRPRGLWNGDGSKEEDEDDFEDRDEGGFLVVRWDVEPASLDLPADMEGWQTVRHKDHRKLETDVSRHTLDWLASVDTLDRVGDNLYLEEDHRPGLRQCSVTFTLR